MVSELRSIKGWFESQFQDKFPCSWKGLYATFDQLFHVEETNRRECKMTEKCVACLLGWRNRSRGTEKCLGTRLSEDVMGCDVVITGSILDHLFIGLTKGVEKMSGGKSKQWALSSVRVAGIRRRQEENGEATRCEHYGGGSSNRVALDVAGEEVMSPREVGMAIVWIVPSIFYTLEFLMKAIYVTPPNLGCSGMLNIRGRYFIDQ
ncbi:hypothetical protein Tco_0059517 [Tanacetum coccineum]